MLLHTESSVLAAIEDPEVREQRLVSLRRERAFGRIASVIAAVGFLASAGALEPLQSIVVFGLLLAVTAVVTVRADAQVNLLLAIDRIEELVAKRARGAAPDDA